MFDEGICAPEMDIKERSKLLRENPHFQWEEASTPQKIWCFGHDNIGPNIMCERTVGVAYLTEIKDSVVGGFKWACNEGPMCEERIRGLKMWINDVVLHADAIHRGMGQISPVARRVTYAEDQYLMKVKAAGSFAPQEEGLFSNSWNGKSHLEMHPWHAAHFALWGRPQLLEKSLAWYVGFLPQAKARATEQGLEGAWWTKRIGPAGGDSPFKVSPFI
eukprot:gene37516-49100_t